MKRLSSETKKSALHFFLLTAAKRIIDEKINNQKINTFKTKDSKNQIGIMR